MSDTLFSDARAVRRLLASTSSNDVIHLSFRIDLRRFSDLFFDFSRSSYILLFKFVSAALSV